MNNAPLLDVFGKGYRLPAGGGVTFQTRYGTAGVRFLTPQPSPSLVNPGAVSNPLAPVKAPDAPAAGGLVNPNPVDDQSDDGTDPPAIAGLTSGNAQQRWQQAWKPGTINSMPRWQQKAQSERDRMQNDQASRFYSRKFARDSQYSTRNSGAVDYWRGQRRIAPNDIARQDVTGTNNSVQRNVPGYGTPAQPELNIGAPMPVEFNQPGTDIKSDINPTPDWTKYY